jgi:hypothetical protein
MSQSRIDPVADLPLAREFMANPLGHHSPNLQRLMRLMRGEPAREKPCLLIVEPGRKWALVRLPGTRGQPPVQLGPVYTNQLEAERDVFRLRWKKLTGVELVLEDDKQ